MKNFRFLTVFFLFVVMIGLILTEKTFSQDAETYYKNAYIFFSQKKYEIAKENYQKAIELKPDFWDARYWLGKTLEMVDEIPEAVLEWKTILVQNPSHTEAFKKWRAYAPYLVDITNQERQNLENVFLYRNRSTEGYLQNPWDTIIPYGLAIMDQNDFVSSFLAARMLRWAASQVSSSLFWYAKYSYQKALDLALQSPPNDSELLYQFIQDLLQYYGDDPSFQKKLESLYNIIFSQQAEVDSEEATTIPRIEIRVTRGGVEREPYEEDGQNHSNPSFYVDPGSNTNETKNGAEGGS